jgi:hypothetical protein
MIFSISNESTSVPGASPALETREALRQILKEFSGVSDVRLLPLGKRVGGARHKVFVVLSAHDVDRDRRIVEVLSQLSDIDMDLVPAASVGMIPDAAQSILS